MKRYVSIGIGFGLAAVCLWLFFRGIDDPALLRERITGASLPLLGWLAASSVAHMVLRAWRWRTLLGEAGRHVPFMELFAAVSIGYMAILLPARVGELIRPTILSRRTGVALGTTLSTVAAERIVLDLPCLLLFLAVWLVLPAGLSGLSAHASAQQLAAVRAAGVSFLVVAVVGFVAAVLLGRHREVVSARLASIAGRRERGLVRRGVNLIASLLPGLTAFGTFGGILRLAVESVAIWTVIAAGIHAGVAACGAPLAPASSLIIVPVTAVGIASGTPGGAGTYQIAMKEALVKLLGSPETAAVAAGLVVHVVAIVPVVALGALFAARGGLGRAAEPAAGKDAAGPGAEATEEAVP